MPASWVKETQESLCQIRQYMKSDFKLHITLESQCADHCCTYALSDSKLEFKKKCSHKHNVTCDRCEMLKNTLFQIKTAVSSKNIAMKLASFFSRFSYSFIIYWAYVTKYILESSPLID